MNWPRILAELKLGGYSQHKLAIILHCPQTRVWRWAHGVEEPSFSQGSKLLELHSSIQFTSESLSSANPVDV